MHLIIKPSYKVSDPIEIKQIILIQQLTLFLTIAVNSGVIYMSRYSTNPRVGIVLLIAEIFFFISYLLARTGFHIIGAVICISTLSLIPMFNVHLSQDLSPGSILILLIWNILTILLSSALLPMSYTIGYSLLNALIIVSFPLLIQEITFHLIFIPLLFNIVSPVTILIITSHIISVEKLQNQEILEINRQLEIELEKKNQMHQKLAYSAYHDSLTDLPNRELLKNRISHAIEYSRRHKDRNYAVIFIDLDGFKGVNDTYGHHYGDHFLIEISKRLMEIIRAQDMVGRLGGDEFVILLEDIADPSEVLTILTRVISAIQEPLKIEGNIFYPTASFGVAMGREDYTNPENIIRNADIAMYRVKKSPSETRYAFFDPFMLESIQSERDLEQDMRHALESNGFTIHYQPIVHTGTKEIAGFEALLRWNHPQKGNISPGEFIPLAEKTGLINPIGYWVLNRVCQQIGTWNERYPDRRDFTVSVNISSRQFQDKGLLDKIRSIFERNETDPSRLKFELTESLLLDKPEMIKTILDPIREMGCQILIDDFGTGFSSLSYLHRLPIDILKVDKSFIQQMNEEKSTIVNTIISLAHSLNMPVIAEGVEQSRQWDLLEKLQCDFIQGFYFSKPVPAEAAEEFIKGSNPSDGNPLIHDFII